MKNFDKLNRLLNPYTDYGAECFYQQQQAQQGGVRIWFTFPYVEIRDQQFFLGPDSRPYMTLLDVFEKVVRGAHVWQRPEAHLTQWCLIKSEDHQLRDKLHRPCLLDEANYEVVIESGESQLRHEKPAARSWIDWLTEIKLRDFLNSGSTEFTVQIRQLNEFHIWAKLAEVSLLDSRAYMRSLGEKYEAVAKQYYPEDQADKNNRVTAWLLSEHLPMMRSPAYQPLTFWTMDVFIAEKIYQLYAANVINPDWMHLNAWRQTQAQLQLLAQNPPAYHMEFHSTFGNRPAGFYLTYTKEPDAD